LENQLNTLKKFWGFNSLREHQEKVIDCILKSNDILALLPTGGGKSICYQLPALIKNGVCIVISPLIALMKDQVENLKKRGINAEYINASINKKSIDIILDNCIYGNIKILYISPERIQSDLFQKRFLKMNISFIAVDEAHCISQWGYDFRPSYLKINILRELNPSLAMVALTATATPKVINDIHEKLLLKNKKTIKQSFKRSNLFLEVIKCNNKINVVKKILNKKSAIVYVRSRKKAEIISAKLNALGLNTDYYHAGLEHDIRSKKQSEWISEKTTIIIATSAFGMGIDKENVRTVIHYDIPESIEAYYQEAGRAGRDGKLSFAYLLYQENDSEKLIYNLSSKYPSIDKIKKTYQQFCNINQISVGELSEKNYEVDFELIAEKTGISKSVTFNCFKQLINQGHLSNNNLDKFFSKIQIICNIETLNNFLEKHEKYIKIIDVLIRSYSGIFENKSTISEKILASRTNKKEHEIKEILAELHSFNILIYKPRINQYTVRLLSPRLDTNKMTLNKQTIINKKNEFYRTQNMINYTNSISECRNKIILDYFGEENNGKCNKCDNCHKEIHKNIQSIEIIANAIEMTLKYEAKEIAKVSLELKEVVNKDKIKETIKWMLDEKRIKINSLNQLIIH
tara:strand:- start:2942 stop:4834 length:1893 start_codon:yes stop_codon:yes gene_type:complete